MTLSTYVRARVFGEEAKRRKRRSKDSVADKKAIAQALALLEQSRITNNLNQLAYHANIGALEIDSKERLQINEAQTQASVLQSKTHKSVRFEICEDTRGPVAKWMEDEMMIGSEYHWPGRLHERPHISARQYARIVRDWATSICLEAGAHGTHSMWRRKVTQTIRKQATYVQFNSCWGTPRWTAP